MTVSNNGGPAAVGSGRTNLPVVVDRTVAVNPSEASEALQRSMLRVAYHLLSETTCGEHEKILLLRHPKW